MKNKVRQIVRTYGHFPKAIYIVFFAKLINSLGVFVFPLLTLILTKKIGLSEAETGKWMTVAGLLYLPSSMVGGKLADLIGRKKSIVIFNILGSILYLICGFMSSNIYLIYIIMIACVFMSVAAPALNALIADLTEPKDREGAYSLAYLGSNIGYAVGPAIAGMLFENHFNLIFIGDAVTAIISTLLLLFFVKETIHKTKDEDVKNRELEKRVDGSILRVLSERPILVYFSLILFGYYFVYAQWGFLVPLHMESLYVGEGAKLYGRLTVVNGLTVIIFTPLITSFFRRISHIRKIFFAGILYTIGFGSLGFINSKFGIIIAVVIITLGEVTVTTNCMPFIANHTPISHRGRVNAIIPSIMGAGFVVGPLIMGYVLEFKPIVTAWKYIGIFMMVFIVFMLVLEKLEFRKVSNN